MHNARVLVAEDNPVNQIVISKMLESLGCQIHAVTNGRAALSIAQEEIFDLAVFDCEMPIMDGLEAAQAIRDLEAMGLDGHRMPIIALTANATYDNRSRCFASGMDDVLTKPCRLAQLDAILSQWLNSSPAAAGNAAGAAPDAANAGTRSTMLDPNAIENIRSLQRPERPDLLAQVITLYFESTPKLVEAMRDAVGRADAPTLRSAAHSLKSSSDNLGAKGLGAICKELEHMGRSDRLDGAAERLLGLDAELESVLAALETLRASES